MGGQGRGGDSFGNSDTSTTCSPPGSPRGWDDPFFDDVSFEQEMEYGLNQRLEQQRHTVRSL